jgi:hypothetical protein
MQNVKSYGNETLVPEAATPIPSSASYVAVGNFRGVGSRFNHSCVGFLGNFSNRTFQINDYTHLIKVNGLCVRSPVPYTVQDSLGIVVEHTGEL